MVSNEVEKAVVAKFMETGLFEDTGQWMAFRLKEVNRCEVYIFSDGKLIWVLGSQPVKFEAVLSVAPKHIQEKLLYHLDLFR